MTKLLAVDVGFRSTGMAIFSYDKEFCPEWKLFNTKCIHTGQEHTERVKDESGHLKLNNKGKVMKKQLTSVAVDDVRRVEYMGVEILNYFIENQCSALVCEIPNGGAQSAAAQKDMGLATGMISMIHVALRCPMEHITPNESRAAAGWIKAEHPMEGLSSTQKTTLMKRFIMAAMAAKYPTIAEYIIADKEHIADACATFEAARDQDVVRQLEVA